MQVEWLRNTVQGGAGITLMTSDQHCSVGARSCGVGSDGIVNASYTGSLDSRIVVRGNVFEGGGGVQLGLANINPNPKHSTITSLGNVLVDSNVLGGGACNLTTRPMPGVGAADINGYEMCGSNCSLHNIVLYGNKLQAVKSCGKP